MNFWFNLIYRWVTICDGIEKGLRKGRGAEQSAAAQLASLLFVQLGTLEEGEEVYRTLKPILLQTAMDKSASLITRAKVNCSRE